jgi:predicted permease
MMKLLLFQLCIIIPMAAGIAIRRFFADPQSTAKRIIGVNLVIFEPIIAFWSLWGLTLDRTQMVLPLSGLIISLCGLAIGTVTAHMLKLESKRRATYLISASLANHGATMGGFVCYLLMGEQGLALSFLFVLYFMPYVLLAMFPYAKRAGASGAGSIIRYSDYFLNTRNAPFLGIALAMACKVAGFPRPSLPVPIDLLIVISVSLYYMTLGLTVGVSNLRREVPSLVSLSLIKFMMIPLITMSALSFFDLDPAVKAVITIQSFMPAAVYSVITAVLFDLDTEMASRLFILNTALFMVCVIPLISAFRGCIL